MRVQRREAIKEELRNQGKANVFADRRIKTSTGARLVRERQMQRVKSNKFNLEDAEAVRPCCVAGVTVKVTLTHMGKAIAEADDFEEEIEPGSEEDGVWIARGLANCPDRGN